MTKLDIAKKMGWSPMYYGRYENDHLTPKGTNIEKFAIFLGTSTSELKGLLNENKESDKVV